MSVFFLLCNYAFFFLFQKKKNYASITFLLRKLRNNKTNKTKISCNRCKYYSDKHCGGFIKWI